MKNKVILVVFMKVIVIMFVHIVDSKAQDLNWMRSYSPSLGLNYGRDVSATMDGGYICISNGQGSSVAVLKTNKFGVTQWLKFIPNSSSSSIIEIADSGFVIIGASSPVSFTKLIRINKIGDTLWSKTYSINSRQSFCFRGKKTMDGGFIITGIIYGPLGSFYLKTDSLGNVEWFKEYSGNGAYDMVETRNGSFYFIGSPNQLRKLNSKGEEIKVIPIAPSIRIDQSSSGSIFIAGNPDSLYFAKLDTGGNFIFQKKIFPNVLIRGLCFNENNDLVISGAITTDTNTSKPNLDIYMARFDSSANFINGKVISFGKCSISEHPSQESLVNIKSSGGGFIACGSTSFPDCSDWIEKLLIIKTDSLFNTSPLIGISNVGTNASSNTFYLNTYPNPFNASVKIHFKVIKSGYVKLSLLDVSGKTVDVLINEFKNANDYIINFNRSDISTGVYLLKYEDDNNLIKINKLILLK